MISEKPAEDASSLLPWIENMNKVMGFIVSVGSIFSLASTTLIIYVYCTNNHIQFLMPLVFGKISFNTFLLFFIPILLIIVFPVYFGVLSGTSALEIKENIGVNYLIGSKKSSLITFGISDIIITIASSLVLLSPFYFFSWLTYIIVSIFLIVFILNCYILRRFLSKKKNKEKFNFSDLIPAIPPSICGCLFIIPYYDIFKNLSGSSLILMLALILPIIFSSYAFFYVLFVERGVFFLIITISALFLFGFPQLLMNSSISNAYFLKMKYGFIPVSIVVPSDCVGKYPEKTNAGTILFNSGSELYVSLDLKLKGSPVSLYLKEGKCSEKIYPSQIIRIPYKDLATIPRF